MGRNKECWGTKGVSASRKLVPCLSLGSRGRGEHDGCPVRAEAWRGCCGTPAWGPVAVGVVTKIHQRCHSLVGGGTEKEILWPLSLPSTFWLPAGIPTLSGPINQRPAGKGARREPSTRGCHPVTRQGRESGEHPGRNTKGGESSPVLPEVGCHARFTNLLHTHECVCVCVCVMENGNDAHLKIPNLLHWMRFGCSHLVSLFM